MNLNLIFKNYLKDVFEIVWFRNDWKHPKNQLFFYDILKGIDSFKMIFLDKKLGLSTFVSLN